MQRPLASALRNVGLARLDNAEPGHLTLHLGLELLSARHVRDHVVEVGDDRPIPPDFLDQPQHPPRIGPFGHSFDRCALPIFR